MTRPPLMPSRSSSPRSRLARRYLGWTWMGLGLAAIALWWLRPAGVPVTLSAKTWQRDIEIETLVDDFASGWCDSLPAGARVGHRAWVKDPSGLRQGAAEHCRYMAPQWRALHSAHAEGDASRAPHWPALALPPLPASANLGAERAGKRHERYEVLLRTGDGRDWRCRLPQAHWQDLPLGLQLQLRIDRFGVADCRSLPPPRGTSSPQG